MDMSVLALILILDFAFTLLHSYQELKSDGAPLWRNFGAIVGVEIPDLLGFLGFTVGLTVILLALGFVGIIGPSTPACTAFALGALIGARLSDTIVSHVGLYLWGYRPNPGLTSTPLYVIEAGFLVYVFQTRLLADPHTAKVGLACGAIFFLLVLPALWLLRCAVPSWRRPRWKRWEPMPSWAVRK